MTGDPLHTRLCEEYGAEYPIVAFAHTRDVTAAASNAGGIGVLGASTHTIEEMRADIRWIKERVGDRPYGVDITIPSSYVRGNQEELEAQIPQGHRDWVERLMRDNDIPDPKGPPPEDVRLRGPARHAHEARDHDGGADPDLRLRPRQPRLHPRRDARGRREGLGPDWPRPPGPA